ncbi:hypothetical protein QVD17_19564 [Tagetes erecta]|uniref:Uncharacterized protein n=1 Tax=Tagetes erecta TaxID=13708 RepID=A0AAD8KK10_TARER|nr:hypothetical protein QVD17_19564 [Tagetes erecta]
MFSIVAICFKALGFQLSLYAIRYSNATRSQHPRPAAYLEKFKSLGDVHEPEMTLNCLTTIEIQARAANNLQILPSLTRWPTFLAQATETWCL